MMRDPEVANGTAVVTVDTVTAAELDSLVNVVAGLVQDRDDVRRVAVVVAPDDPLDAVSHLVEVLDGQARHYGKRVDIRRTGGP